MAKASKKDAKATDLPLVGDITPAETRNGP